MLKAADALAEAGYQVRVVSARYMDWAWHADQDVRRTRSWRWTVVNYDRGSARSRYLRTGLRFRSAQALVKRLGPARCPFSIARRAYSRAHHELVKAVLREPADFIYGGTSGALAAIARAAVRAGVPYALDLEDFHSAENENSPEGRLTDALAEQIEREVLNGAVFLSAGSAAIAQAYRCKYGVNIMPQHNVFPLPRTAPDLTPSTGCGLRIYWFGQTIGHGRGLEAVIRAMGRADIAGEIHLRGRPAADYVQSLRRLSGEVAPDLNIAYHSPAPPDSMVDLCRGYDVGLAVDEDRELSLTNKALTYGLAGVAPALSDTIGQRAFGQDLGEAAILVRPGDVDGLAAGLKRWSENKSLLARAKASSWEAAKRRWHWEHPEERGALLKAVDSVF